MLSPEIKFYRESDVINQETTYVFKHALLGTLGRLTVISSSPNTRLIWEPSPQESAIKNQLEAFVARLIKNLQSHFNSQETHLFSCPTCGSVFARLIYVPGAQTLESLKERVCLKGNANETSLLTWIIGEQHVLEVIWPIRCLFRVVSLEDFMHDLKRWEKQHCAKILKFPQHLQ